jgi:ABC-2 type transport system ATP-binding protein
VGLGQALLHDPKILILDEPTADLDPNEKAEVIRYIQEIGKDRTVLLSTHNLQEAEEACGRAIIVSKGRVVADGNLDEIRARTGSVRYVVTVDGAGISEIEGACSDMKGVKKVRELSKDDGAFRVELQGEQDGDLRAEIFRLMVDKGWTMLELRRDAQSLDSVFRDLTKGDEALDRGREWDEAEAEVAAEGADDEDLDDEEDSSDDEAHSDDEAPDSEGGDSSDDDDESEGDSDNKKEEG